MTLATCLTLTWLLDPDSVPAPLSCALADASNIAAASSLVARPGLRPASDRPSRGLQCACAAAAPARWSSAGVARPQAARRPRSVLTRHLVDFVHRPGQRSCATHADASVARLVDLVLAIKAPLRSAFMAKPNPPSPWKGALTRPANITRGDYAHCRRATLPDRSAARRQSPADAPLCVNIQSNSS